MVSCIVDYMGQVLWSLAHIRPHASPKPIISLVLGPNLGTGVFLCCPQILASPNASHQKDLVTLWGPTWSGTPHLHTSAHGTGKHRHRLLLHSLPPWHFPFPLFLVNF